MLLEAVKRLMANNDLDEEYLRIVASGGAGVDAGRLDSIIMERKENARVVGRLLEQLRG